MKGRARDLIEELRGASDEELVGMMARRDEGALRELYRRYAPFLVAMARRMNSGEGAERLVQDAFVRFWEGARRFDPVKSSARTWIVTTAHRLAVNRFAGSTQMPASFEAESLRTGDGEAEGTELYVSEALDRLDPLARQLLELAFFGGRDHQSLIDLSGRPPATVKTSLRRALASLHGTIAGGAR